MTNDEGISKDGGVEASEEENHEDFCSPRALRDTKEEEESGRRSGRATGGAKLAANYLWGFLLFWVTGLGAQLAGNLITADGNVAGWAGMALQIIFLTLIIWWAIRRKVRGIIPGVCIGVAMHVATVVWIMRK